MTTMFFYEQPTALNRERHRNLKLNAKPGDFSFAQKTNSSLLAVTEVSDAALSYPIIFAGNPGGPYTLAALLGLNDGENLFVNDGVWETERYVPAFARRYPFVLAEGESTNGDLTVCIDEAFAGLSHVQGEPLFDAEGKETKLLQNAVEFLQIFHFEMQRTKMFAQRMTDLGLLVQKIVEINRSGTKHVLEGLYIIDRSKLAELDDKTVLELFRSGEMSMIEAHLLSLKNTDGLAARLDRRAHAQSAVDTAGAASGAALQ